MSKNLSNLAGRKGLQQTLFEQLGKAASKTGTPTPDEIEKLAEQFVMGAANVYGTTTFYDFLRPENQGKKVYVCNGSACLTAGTQHQLKANLLQQFTADEIGEMCCLGRCHQNSAFFYNQKNYSGNAITKFNRHQADQNATDNYYVGGSGKQLLIQNIENIIDYYQILASALKQNPVTLLNELKQSGLRGRGGAGFPIAIKLESCSNEISDKKFIVCNADEGDPGAYSDRYLLEQQPHKVLLGMLLAGFMANARYGVLYIRAEYPEAIAIIKQQIEFLHNAGLLGEQILGSDFSFSFKVIAAQGAYICGEETALLSSIEGQRPEVRVRPPYPVQKGLFNKPTVVNNVETLACIPYIIQNGGHAFAAIGKGKSTGTKLVSLDSHFNRPGIYEIDMGTPLQQVIETLGMGFKSAIKAMHIGGPLGGLVPVHCIKDLTVDFESFTANGFLLGHASVVCIPQTFNMVDYLKHLFQFTAHESCGKCFPCRLGSTRGAELLEQAISHNNPIDAHLFSDLLNTMEIGSLCALGGGLPLPVKNALQYFKDELAPYFKNQK
ncbi:MAG: NAD(P)H-dependent oxidoreductase subunit E [Bacteroidia bacterium]|nr:NAD(P)H-dependent oxidoreductase subunit E [Bacteroidia bacterium]HQU99995.1 NADH-ubiquinone oxidoreductase-F iron-sulfur binding region domain-containing protein [Bacteroidia bacterium]